MNYMNSALFSSFFKAEDFKEAPRVFTVASVAPQTIGPEGRQEEKLVLKVEEDERGITLNKTRYQDLGEIFGSLDTDEWIGKKVKLIFDPSIKFGGRKVGGIACQPAE